MTSGAHFNEYEVGGCVRDAVLGRRAKDVDVAMELRDRTGMLTATDAFELMREDLEARGFQIFDPNAKYFTIRAHWPEDYLDVHGTADFVLCRRDGPYTDGRRPDFVEVGTLMDDLARRDFTMNAIARQVGNRRNLIDPFNGLRDIEHKTIRCVGDPTQRFVEDPLRVVRALRFAITLGFEIEAGTWDAIVRLLPEQITGVAKERRRDELEKMFQADTLATMELFEHYLPVETKQAIFAGIRLRPTFTFKGSHAGRTGASHDQDQDA